MHGNGALLTDFSSQRLMTNRVFPSPAINGFCMVFNYHMYGSNVGKLSVIMMKPDGTYDEVSQYLI